MNEHPRPTSRLPEGASEHTFLVYDPASGEVVHGHKAVVFPYGNPPSHEQLERQALDLAAEATGREASSMRALRVGHEELEHGVAYRVDPGSGRLQRSD